jgi:hypothetical protein
MQTENSLVNTLRENNFFFFVLLIKEAEAELLLPCKFLLQMRHSKSSRRTEESERLSPSLFAQQNQKILARAFLVEEEPLRMESTMRASSVALR